MICNRCKIEFQPKNKKARFCSTKCRVYAGRDKQRIVTDEIGIVTDEIGIVTEVPKIVTKKPVKRLSFYLEEYEKVYLEKTAPKFIPQKKWDEYRDKKLEEIKKMIILLNG